MAGVRRRQGRYLLDTRFQLKWTSYLVVVVLLVMAGLGVVIANMAGRASDTAGIAVTQAEKAYEESKNNSILAKKSVELAAPESAALKGLMDDGIADIEAQSAKNVADVKKLRADIDRQRMNLQLLLGGAGLVLVVLLIAMGIVITHRIVGPVHKMKRLLRRVSTGRLVIDERLRKGDELEELFDTFLQMTYSLRAIQSARLATLDGTLKKAEETNAPQEVIDGMRALRAQMVLGIERRRASIPPPAEV